MFLKDNHPKAPIGTYLILFALFRRDIDIYYASKLKLSQAIACEQIAIFGMTYFRSKNRLAHVVICFSLIQQRLNLSLIIRTLFIIQNVFFLLEMKRGFSRYIIHYSMIKNNEFIVSSSKVTKNGRQFLKNARRWPTSDGHIFFPN